MPVSRPAIGSLTRKEVPSGKIRLRHAAPAASADALILAGNEKRSGPHRQPPSASNHAAATK